jgi:hypothetical protein
MGQIITFYSYKGGTGRTMALANVAWILAEQGQRVLVVDWDLEAPGLHRFFMPFLRDPANTSSRGIVELFHDYLELKHRPTDLPPGYETAIDLADPSAYVQVIDYNFRNHGSLHLLGAGQQGRDYAKKVQNLNWRALYAQEQGKDFVDQFREICRQRYDIVLIDSRTGISDTAGICTIQLPDMVVACFTYNRQSIEGASTAVSSILEGVRARGRSVRLQLLPCRVAQDVEGVDSAREFAIAEFSRALTKDHAIAAPSSSEWRRSEVQHYPAYAFHECLAAFREVPKTRGNLLADMAWLAGQVLGTLEDQWPEPPIESDRKAYLAAIQFGEPALVEIVVQLNTNTTGGLKQLIHYASAIGGIHRVPEPTRERLRLLLSEVCRHLEKDNLEEAVTGYKLLLEITRSLESAHEVIECCRRFERWQIAPLYEEMFKKRVRFWFEQQRTLAQIKLAMTRFLLILSSRSVDLRIQRE